MSELESAAQEWLGENAEEDVSDVADERDEQGGGEADEPVELSAEDLARQRGWKSREEWKGPIPQQFVDDPEEFNRQFESSIPRLVQQNKELAERLERQGQAFQKWTERLEEADRREREKLQAEIERRHAEAVKLGDQNAAAQAIRDRDELRKADQPAYNPNTDPAFTQWVQSDSAAWYREGMQSGNDPRIQFAQAVVAPDLQRQGITPQNNPSFYEMVTQRVNQAFGQSQGAASQKAPAVEGARRSVSPKPRSQKRGWADIPRAQRESPENRAILKSLYRGDKEKFAAAYFKQEKE